MLLRRAESGFTYVEMLVVLLLGSALYAAALGPVREYMEGRKRAKCADNLHKLQLVMALYANEHDGAYPKADDAKTSDDAFALLVPKYTSDPEVFRCAAGEKKTCYAYAMGLRRDDPPTALVADAGAHGKVRGNVLFSDGHVETESPVLVSGKLPISALPPHAKILQPRP